MKKMKTNPKAASIKTQKKTLLGSLKSDINSAITNFLGKPASTTKAQVQWNQYLAILEKRGNEQFFSGSWVHHLQLVNPHLQEQYGVEISYLGETNPEQLEILGHTIAEIIRADGVLKPSEVNWFRNMGFPETILSAPCPQPQDRMLVQAFRSLEGTDREICFFYHLITAALCDDELHENELALICRIAELRNRTWEILRIIHACKNKCLGSKKEAFVALERLCQMIGETAERYGHTLKQLKNPQVGEMLEEANWLDSWLGKFPRQVFPANAFDGFRKLFTRLKNPLLKVGFIGITSSGKTCLINAMVGGELLFPEKVQPTTNLGVEIVRGSKRQATVCLEKGRQETWTGEKMIERLHEATNEGSNPGNRMGITRVYVEHPHFLLPEDMVALDTPGLNAFLHEDHADLTLRHILPDLDIVVYLTRSSNLFKQQDMETLQKILEKDDQRVIFVITGKGTEKASYVDGKRISREEKWTQLSERLRIDLRSAGFDPDQFSVHLVDSLWAQWGRLGFVDAWNRSGFGVFLEDLMRHAGNLQKSYRNKCLESGMDYLSNLQKDLETRQQGEWQKQQERQNSVKESIKAVKKAYNKLEVLHSDLKARCGADIPRLRGSFSCYSESSFNSTRDDLQEKFSSRVREANEQFDELQNKAREIYIKLTEQYSELNLKWESRRDASRKMSAPSAPESADEKYKERVAGAWNWLKSLVGCEDYEIKYRFDQAKSEARLEKFEENFREFALESLDQNSQQFEKRYVAPLEEKMQELETQAQRLEKTVSPSEGAAIDHLKKGITYVKTRLHELEQNSEIAAPAFDEKTQPEVAVAFPPRRSGPRSWWQSYSHKNNPETLCILGGRVEQQATFLCEILGPNSFKEEKEGGIKRFRHSDDWLNLLSITEVAGQGRIPSLKDLGAAERQEILDNTDSHIGLYVDFQRFGNGIGDVSHILGKDLEQIIASNRLFLWNLEMGGINEPKSLHELLTYIPQQLNSLLKSLPPVLLSQGPDSRWTNLWKLVVCNEASRDLLTKWRKMRLSFRAPFTDTIISQLETSLRGHYDAEIQNEKN